MIQQLLLPNQFKKIGWALFIPATLFGILLGFTDYEASWLDRKVFALIDGAIFDKSHAFALVDNNITNELVGLLFIVGAVFVGFSKEKQEDEFIAELRLSSLLWAVWLNYIVLFLAIAFIYGTAFLTVMMYNMFTVLLFFILRFNYILYKTSKAIPGEKQY